MMKLEFASYNFTELILLRNTIIKALIKESVKKDIVKMSLFYYNKNEIDTGTAFAKNLEGFCSLK
jgi:hypothetical protein